MNLISTNGDYPITILKNNNEKTGSIDDIEFET